MLDVYPEIKKNFGFGMMRLPMIGEDVDIEQTKDMVDLFMANGFNYFDTAHIYLHGKSETAIREALSRRYPRDSFILTDKLSNSTFTKQEDIRPLIIEQLKACGVNYFDFLLMHNMNLRSFNEKYKPCKAIETAFQLKEEGLVRHVGLSCHDKAEALDQILTEYPQLEIVQLQINYLDWEDASVESRKCYEVCVKHNKPVIVMEPVKGGSLVDLPNGGNEIFAALNGGSNASYAIRFAASQPQVRMVLSGMSAYEQMKDNVNTMKEFKPLDEKEYEAIDKVREIFQNLELIKCTACRYCTDGCPMQIRIPDLFACYNKLNIFQQGNMKMYYRNALTTHNGKASDCIQCGQCEGVCPQHLPIISLMQKVAETFETENR